MHSGLMSRKKVKIRFYFFLQKQRTQHAAFLIGESLLLPISGLAALLPGPNVFFGVLALLMVTHWHALRGINRLLKRNVQFTASFSSLRDWEKALESEEDEEKFSLLLKNISKEHSLPAVEKILWK